MAHIATAESAGTTERPVASAPDLAQPGAVADKAAAQEVTVKMECELCGKRFLFDVEEAWSTTLRDIEMLGRQFLGVGPDVPLCPRCLHDVQKTGAERMYWKYASC